MKPDYAREGSYQWNLGPCIRVHVRRRPSEDGGRTSNRGVFELIEWYYQGPTVAGVPKMFGPWIGRLFVYRNQSTALAAFRRWLSRAPSSETVLLLRTEGPAWIFGGTAWPVFSTIGSEPAEKTEKPEGGA